MPEPTQGSRICLFGGTFDPIHLAHLRIANEALKRFDLDRVLFVPAAHPPHKQAMTPFEDRFRMVEIACGPYPSFVASRLEANTEVSYTVDTLERFRKETSPNDRAFFLIGSDAFAELTTWHRWQEVAATTEFIVVARSGATYQIPEGVRVLALDDLVIEISSSAIRNRLAAGEEVSEVPVEVRDYIESRGLYRHLERNVTASQ